LPSMAHGCILLLESVLRRDASDAAQSGSKHRRPKHER
jgi:hypothetical protein